MMNQAPPPNPKTKGDALYFYEEKMAENLLFSLVVRMIVHLKIYNAKKIFSLLNNVGKPQSFCFELDLSRISSGIL